MAPDPPQIPQPRAQCLTNESQQEVVAEILKVLQRIEVKLNGQEQRVQTLEQQKATTGAEQEDEKLNPLGSDQVDTAGRLQIPRTTNRSYTLDEGQWPSRKGSPIKDDTSLDCRSPLKIFYSKWSFNNVDRFLDIDISRSLSKRLGDCWGMPDDSRLPLKFFISNIVGAPFAWSETHAGSSRVQRPVEQELEFLCQFDSELRKQSGNDFMVVDFDEADNTRIYRLGDEAIGIELEVEPCQQAPWSRLMIIGLWDHLDYHLQTKRRGTTTNPYANAWNGFHTDFYEVREITEWQVSELWKHGPLYGHPLGWHFRKCAYTVYTPVPVDADERHLSKLNRHWTLLVLSPDGFFDEKNISFPMDAASLGRAQAVGYPLGRLTRLGAELHMVGQGLERITARWADFLSYFDFVLDGGDALMKPTEHDNLLFDDGAFSRSRKYFWAIDCLSEFELSISDNITQWELYKSARLPRIEELAELDQRQLSFADRQYRVLQNQRESFRQKLALTKALRDALFNASAVIESRASTRLGENVKLLTFVSIFFLPLSFTTSLWSVNDRFDLTVLIYVIIIVALLTYLVMFNINSLAEGFGQVYGIKKKYIIRAMKNDANQAWKLRGQRFEIFRPKHEKPEPSEWYIPLYALMHPTTLLGLYRDPSTDIRLKRNNSQRIPPPAKSGGISGLFRRRKHGIEEEGRPDFNDQPWVIETKPP